MAEKTLKTRLILKHDTIAALNSSTFIPKKGEAILAEITVNKKDPVKGTVAVPTYMMKVGDGKSTFSELNWVAAPAADVYDWAKAATKPSYSHTEISGLADNYDSKGAASTAEANAKGYTDNLAKNAVANNTAAITALQAAVGEDADGLAAKVQANTNAIATLNGADTVDGSVAKQVKDAKDAAISASETDATSKATTAQENAKSYTDTQVSDLADGAVATNTSAIATNTSAIATLNGSATTAGSVKKQVADAKSAAISVAASDATTKANAAQSAAEEHADSGDTTTLESAKSYTNGEIAKLSGTTGSLTTLGNRVSALETTVGDSESGLVKDVADNTSAISDEVARATEAESALSSRITTNKNAIDKLNGAEATAGSVKAIAKSYADVASNAVTSLANGQVKTNKEAIAVINGDGEGSIFKALKDAKDYTDSSIKAIPAQTDYTVTCVESTPTGYAKAYTLSQCGGNIVTINIPKDMVVSSGTVETNPEGQDAGTYLVLTLANAASDKIYINVGDLIEYVTSGSATSDSVQVAVSSDHKVTASIKDGSVTKAKLATAVQTSLGKADTSLQSVTAGTGLKSSGSEISFDDSTVFVLDGGTATTNIA